MRIWGGAKRGREDRDDIPETIGREGALLRCEIRDVTHSHRLAQLTADVEKRLENGGFGVQSRGRVLQTILDGTPLCSIGKAGNQTGILVEVGCSRQLCKGVDLLRGGFDLVKYLAAVERGLGEGAEVEAGDDAEIVGAAAESYPEIGMGSCVGRDQGTVGENNVKREDVVADEAEAGAEE